MEQAYLSSAKNENNTIMCDLSSFIKGFLRFKPFLIKCMPLILACFLIMNGLESNAQFSVNSYLTQTKVQTANTLVSKLMGTGVTFSGASLQCVVTGTQSQVGYFTTAGTTKTQLGFSDGVVLSTGYATTNAKSWGSTCGSDNDIRQGGSCPTYIKDLDVLAGTETYNNAVVLEFDFVPVSDKISFRYVFGSDEYGSFNCTIYNDKFGFLISGAGIAGGQGYDNNARNVARLSNGSEVGINSVNDGTLGTGGGSQSNCIAANPAWVYNTVCPEYNGLITGINYEGNTKVLTASQDNLTPGATYHIKLLILDAHDSGLDSGVFIEAGSFSSPTAQLTMTATPATICKGASTTLETKVNSGTAPYTYTWSDGTSTFSTTTDTVGAIKNLVVSPTITTTYTVTVVDHKIPTATTATSSVVVTVNNPPTAEAGTSPGNITCANLTRQLTASGGSSYSWTASGGGNITAGAATATPTINAGGTYTVTVTSGGCTATDNVVVVEDKTAPTAEAGTSPGNITCTNTSRQLSGSGGTSYSWSGGTITAGALTATPTITAGGTYTVTVTGANGCTATDNVVVVEDKTPPTANAGTSPGTITCTNTSYNLTATGGGSYSWSATGGGVISAGALTSTPTITSGGTYIVTVTGANGCTASSNVIVSQSTTAPSADAGTSPGTITCTNSSYNLTGTGGASYSWSATGGGVISVGALTATPTITAGGTYTVTVTGANGCTATDNVVVAENKVAPAAEAGVSPGTITCTIPTRQLTATGGGSYSWSGGTITAGALTATPTISAGGTYTVTVTAANGCTAIDNVIVAQNNSAPTIDAGTNQTIANGTSTLINASVTAGSGNYTYSWNPAAKLVNATIQDPTTIILSSSTLYTLTVTDTDNGCTATDQVTVDISGAPLNVISITGTPSTICKGGSTQLEAIASGGAGAGSYVYSWTSTPAGFTSTIYNPIVSPTTTTTYVIQLSDAFTTVTDQIIVNVLPLPTGNIAGSTTVCKDASAPTITFTGGNATAPYTFTYTINGGSSLTVVSTGNTATITAPTGVAGTYAYDLISVQDGSANSCSQAQTGTATIVVNPLPTASIAGSISVCKDASTPVVTFTGANGTSPYTFTYTLNSGGSQTVVSTGNTATITAPTGTAGTYTYALVNVQDASSTTCSNNQTGTAIVIVNPLPSANISGTISVCKDAASPDVIFTGANGTAPYTFTYTINGGSSLNVSSTGNTASVTVPTGTPGTNTYLLVSIQDASSTTCSQSQTGNAVVTVNPLPTANITGSTSVCKDDASPTITFTGANGTSPYTFTYSINGGGSQTVVSSGNIATVTAPTGSAGTYTYTMVSVQDASSTTCSNNQSGSAIITINPLPTANITGTTSVCQNGTAPNVTFTGANGTAPYTFTYNINGGGSQSVVSTGNTATVSALTGTAGTFTYNLVSVRDASSTTCLNNQTGNAVVTVNPLPTATINGATSVCQNGTNPDITLTGSNGVAPYTFTYSINGGSNLTATTTSGNSINISVPTGTAGTYTYDLISVQDASSTTCLNSQSGSAVVTVNPLPTAIINGTTVVCQNATAPNIVFTGANGTAPYTFTYNINGGSSFTTTTTAGNSVTITAPTGTAGAFTYNLLDIQDASSTMCSNNQTGSAIVTVNALPTATISGATALCQNEAAPSITFTGANGIAPYTFTYNINGAANKTVVTTSGNSVTVLAPTSTMGTYTYNLVNVQDASVSTCLNVQTGNATVLVNALPTVVISGDNSVCDGSVATMAVSGASTYLWSTGSTDQIITVIPLVATTYTVTGTDINGCKGFNSNSVDIRLRPVVSIVSNDPNNEMYEGQSLTFTASPAGYDSYNFKVGITSVQIGTSNIYVSGSLINNDKVEVVASNDGCSSDKDFVIVRVFRFPNAFSPDADGINDRFLKGLDLTVFNRWGQELYKGKEGWDGKYKGETVNPGTYFYIVTYKDKNNQDVTKNGSVTITY